MDKDTLRFIFIAIIYFVYFLLQHTEGKRDDIENNNPPLKPKNRNNNNIEIKNAWILNHNPINHYCNTVSADDSYYVENPIQSGLNYSFCQEVNYKNNSTFTIFLN